MARSSSYHMRVSTKAFRYAVVGVVTFVIDFCVTSLLYGFAPLLIANSIGFLSANIANFLLAHRWVFQHEWDHGRLVEIYVSVLGVSLIGLVLNNLVVWMLVAVTGLSLLIGKVAATAVVMVWNFLARLLWVYKHKEHL
jgi:putative flippase GtrA